ncbi:type III restriction protein res subunit [Lactobacillus selangorensis]|uniref:Type III restriction protein res subunit n=1 Tax=Lactobacillus selangorensis TaxID=81857 RepID=A0A0R2FGI7_9LACO|nr:DEAD/DEAH box helicase [Lactobacillus selangorensis]KRN27730.1 type III restriction protein res subunit [Lactobacillus selangorensis]KRN30305.1 type III restriction protein res subunit [Lactobacillus selangorensis]
MYKLRDYQLETIQKIVKEMKKGHHSIMVQQPPRTGKTVIMAEIARRTTLTGGRVLFIVHRKEIVDQVKETFQKQGVDMDLATVGMVQTLTRHVDKLPKPAFLFVDEAHHVLAKSYLRILDAFPDAYKLLFTATPIRLNGEGFESVADVLITGKSVKWLIDHDRLAPVDYYAPIAIDNTALKTKRTGEFTEDSIEKALKPKIYGNAVKNYQKLAAGKQAIAYTYNVASAERLANAFNAAGISARAVSGKTNKDERNKIVSDYKDGKIRIVTNAELFTEGIDLPNVDCVIMLRPTQSLSLFLQFSMRSMNPREGKTAIIIDHVGNVERFGLPTDDREWSLTGTAKTEQSSSAVPVKSVSVCPECFATFYRKGDTCPFCGANLGEEKKIEVVEDAELKKVIAKRKDRVKKIIENNAIRAVADKKPGDLHSMAELKAYAELHNYKKGWIYFQAKAKGLIKQ